VAVNLFLDIMSSQEAILKSYQKILKDHIKSMVDSYLELIKVAKVDPVEGNNLLSSGQVQENYEMSVRAANIAKASKDLLKLIYNIKQFLIINDFPLINEAFSSAANLAQTDAIDARLCALRDDVSAELFELGTEYYNSLFK
jgi:hypothetical protein